MKIKVISHETGRAKQIAQLIKSPGLDVSSKQLDCYFKTNGEVKTRYIDLPTLETPPKLVIIDDINASDLNEVERFLSAHSETEIIIFSTEQSPSFLIKAMQIGVREVLPVELSPTELQEAVQRALRKRGQAQREGEVLAFITCKGGNGTSFLAANLAHTLSERGKAVALIDLNLQFGDALLMLTDQRARSDIGEVASSIERLDADLLRSAMVQVSPTLSVLSVPTELSQALNVKAEHVEAIIKQAQQLFDFVVLDVGRSIDALSLQAMDLSSVIFPVLQLSLPQLRDAKRLHALFHSLEYPSKKIHWLVNRYQKGGELSLDALEQALSTKELKVSTIPNHYPSVSASANQGEPIGKATRGNPVARAIHDLSLTLVPAEEKRKSNWLNRFS